MPLQSPLSLSQSKLTLPIKATKEMILYDKFVEQKKTEQHTFSIRSRDGLAVEITDNIKTATRLSNEVKDIRDELNILGTVVRYQQVVQTAIEKEIQMPFLAADQSGQSDLARLDAENSSTSIADDIRQMEKMAEQFQSAVNLMIAPGPQMVA